MRDTASAAAMSDPMLNRWFRRRWVEAPGVDPAAAAGADIRHAVEDDVASTSMELLEEWRRSRQPGMVPW